MRLHFLQSHRPFYNVSYCHFVEEDTSSEGHALGVMLEGWRGLRCSQLMDRVARKGVLCS